jgi:hypothetical protein
MRTLKRSIALSSLVFGLLTVTPPLALPGVTQTAVQSGQTNEIDQAIAEGVRLFKEGSAESLRKAIAQFERALALAR